MMEVATGGRTEFENSPQSRKKLNDLTSDRLSTSPFQRFNHHQPGNHLHPAVENLYHRKERITAFFTSYFDSIQNLTEFH